MIGLENLRHSLNQQDAKWKPITTCTFSRALGRLVVFTLGSHWLLPVLSFHLIGCCDNTGVGFTTLNRKALYLVDGAGFLQQSRKAVRQTTTNRNYCKPSIETHYQPSNFVWFLRFVLSVISLNLMVSTQQVEKWPRSVSYSKKSRISKLLIIQLHHSTQYRREETRRYDTI